MSQLVVHDTDETFLKPNLQSGRAVVHETIHRLPLPSHDSHQILGALLFFHWPTQDADHLAACACVIEIPKNWAVGATYPTAGTAITGSVLFAEADGPLVEQPQRRQS
ncbi:MAG TPA: hypothetical protein VGI50_01565 [Solirubrobacteraceae bacterium]